MPFSLFNALSQFVLRHKTTASHPKKDFHALLSFILSQNAKN